jgi:hypothetical protein
MKEDRHCYKNFGLKWSFNYSQNTMVSSKLRYSKQNILHANLFIAMSDQAKCARSEAAFSASDNRCLADNDARRWITQNRQQREYGRDPVDLHNTIDDRRRDRARTSSPSGARICGLPLHQGGAHSMLRRLGSGRSPDPTSSSLDRSTSVMTPATLKSLSKSTTRSMRLLAVMISLRPTICPRH